MHPLVALSLLAWAQDPSPVTIAEAIEVEAGEAACLDAEQLASQVRVWLGRDEISPRLKIHARSVPQRSDRVDFWVERDGERVVDRPFEPVPGDCDALHAALGLAIAFAIDATVLEELGIEATRGSDPPPPEDLSTPLDAEENPAGEQLGGVKLADEKPNKTRRRRVALRVQGSGAYGLHPGAALGGQLLTAFSLNSALTLRVGGGASAGLAQALGDGEVRTTLMYGRVDLCAGGRLKRVDLRGCAGSIAGWAGVQGSGYTVSNQSLAPWVSVLAGAALTVPQGKAVAFALDADLIVPLRKPRIVVTDTATGEVGAALNVPALGGMLTLGASFQFR